MIRELIMQEKCDNRSTQQLRAMNMTTLGARDRSRSPCIVLSVCQTREKKRREREREVCNCEKKRRGVSGMYRSVVLQYTYIGRIEGWGERGGRLLSCPTDVSPRESIVRHPLG